MDNKVTVFGKEKCMQCKMVKSFMETNGIDYHYIDVEKCEAGMNELKAAGFTSVPVTKNRDGSYIVGFAIGQLRELKA